MKKIRITALLFILYAVSILAIDRYFDAHPELTTEPEDLCCEF